MPGCFARNAVSDTTKYALMRKAKCSLFVVDATNQNCKEFSNIFFIITVLNILTQNKKI